MRLLEGEWIYSPSDLVGFAACEHLTALDRRVALGELTRPERDDPFLAVLSRRGDEHEASVLESHHAVADAVMIKADTRTRAGLVLAAEQTIDAMREGAPLIYQAAFFHDGWVGNADFLERVDEPSELGDWSYEVADAKLVRSVKPGAILQLCGYSEHVERIQGRAPNHIHVVTGDNVSKPLRLADYAAYYRTLKRRFVEAAQTENAHTYPDPVEHCAICRWSKACAMQRRTDDHLSLVAGMRRDQTRKLIEAGIATRSSLGAAEPEANISGIGAGAFERLRHQAELQVRGDRCVPPLYELLEPDTPGEEGPERGFAALPPPSLGDLFLDLEGDPYALDGGLEYLFGIVELVDGEPLYHSFWAHSRADEKQAFEQAVDFMVERLRRDPEMHVYHYAAYEPSAVRRLMGAHGTRETEVDELLRAEHFVDLYQVVRQGVRLSTESYSLKEVEKLYMKRPSGAVMDAGSSIVAYEEYLQDGDTTRLREIEDYNRDDCMSTLGLRGWLEERRLEAETTFGAIPRSRVREGEPSPELSARDAAAAELAERLAGDVPADRHDRNDEQQARWLLAQLLQWHRRENKPAWWIYYHRVRDCTDDDYFDDSECIGGLTRVSDGRPEKQSLVFRYEFPVQEHKIGVSDMPHDPATEDQAGTVFDLGDDWIELKRGRTLADAPHPSALVPHSFFDTPLQQGAIAELAEWVVDNGIEAAGPNRAARELLLRRAPRLIGTSERAELVGEAEPVLDAACRVVHQLDETCLPIQGPPGAGKTFTGAHMIVALLDQGRRVGVTANSHSAISNLLDEVCRIAREEGVEICALQRAKEEQRCASAEVKPANHNREVEAGLADGDVNLVAGTAWLWADPRMRGAVDVLFVDEAGQLSLANVVAVAGAASSVVLLGDPQQLAQPSQASHPEGAGVSALEHLLREHETIPPDLGIFLDETYRMHPAVCAFISEIVYEGRLESADGMELQAVDGWAGLRFVPVEHVGNRSRSPEEATRVTELIGEVVGTEWTDDKGKTRKLTLDALIVIAPFNAHVAEIRRHAPEGARIGTVDKFQGRQGSVAIYSMASSSVEDAPRGMNFLYDLHRFNVAVSRARAVGIVVCSPELLRVLCNSPEQMRLANALCRFVELASTEGENDHSEAAL